MATVKQMVEEFVSVTDVPRSAVNSFARRLSEADMVDRGVKGHAILNISARSIANMIIALLVQSDGYDTVSARIVSRVIEVGNLHCVGSCSIALGDSTDALDNAFPVFNGNSFSEEIANLLIASTKPDFGVQLNQMIIGVGVGFNGSAVRAWVEVVSGLELLNSLGGTHKGCTTDFLPGGQGNRAIVSRGKPSGLARESILSWDAIKHLAAIGAKDNPDWGA